MTNLQGGNSFYHVETEPTEMTFVIGSTQTLFESNTAMDFAIPPKGDRLLVLEDADEGGVIPLTLVTGWRDDLERRRARR